MKLFRRRLWKYSKRATILIAVIAVILLVGGGAVFARLGGFGTPSTSSNIDLQKGLVGWWKMDGNAKDSTPYRNNGTVTGATLASDRKGQANSAYSFNGTSSYITAGVNGMPDPHNAYSFSAWIYPTDTSGTRPIIDLRNNAGTLLEFQLQSGYLELWGNGNNLKAGGTGCASCAVNANQWHHVVFTYPGAAPGNNTSGWLLYIDGQQVYSGSSFPDGSAGAASLFWMGHVYGSTNYFAGTIDDVQVWKRVVSADEITALYKGYDASPNVAQGEKGLVGWWKMNGTLQDSSPYRTACSQPYGSANGGSGPDRKGRANGSYAPSNLGAQCGKPTALQVSKLTISAWVDSTSYNTAGNGIGGWGGVYDFSIDADSLCLNLRDSSNQANYFCTTGTYTLNTWYYVAATYDGSTVQLYVNGAPVAGGGSFTSGIGTSHYADPSNVFNLGVFGAASSGRRFMGYIDDLRVYNRALSSTEIANQYNSYNSQIGLGGAPGSSINLQKGLVGYWPLNGNAHDATPYRDNGTVSGATLTTDRKGRANSAYKTNNSQDITFGATPSLDVPYITVSAWVYYQASNASQTAVSRTKASSVIGDWTLGTGSNNTQGFSIVGYGSAGTSAGTGYSWSTWMMLTGTYDGTNITFYLNGVQVATTVASKSGALPAGLDPLAIGGKSDGSYDYQHGGVDDVRIYNRALSAAEVQALYQEYN